MESQLYGKERKYLFGLKTKPAIYYHKFNSIKEFLDTAKLNPSKLKKNDRINLNNLRVERKGEDFGLIDYIYPVTLKDDAGKINTLFKESLLDMYHDDFDYAMRVLRKGDILTVTLLYEIRAPLFGYDILSFRDTNILT